MIQGLLQRELLLHWVSVGFYAISAILFLFATSFARPRVLRSAFCLTVIGMGVHAAAFALRWAVTGRLPAIGRYETFSGLALVGVITFLVVGLVRPELRWTGVLVMPFSFLTIGLGVMASPEIRAAPRSFATYWLVIHVLFAKLAFGASLVGTSLAWLGIWKGRDSAEPRREVTPPEPGSFPAPAALDELSYRFIGLAFLALVIMLISGSIWANLAWGAYWGWEPVETWSLIAWLVYGIYLHLRRTYGWRGRRAAWVATLGFALFLFALWGLGAVFENQHSRYFQ
ncbi:MAG TPA: cytochrome c biogenesis protein CcsA [Firmicutes bacterium]|nr:cytochrome c biogenesis protein CcsA [Bacillota bacterium]